MDERLVDRQGGVSKSSIHHIIIIYASDKIDIYFILTTHKKTQLRRQLTLV